MIVTDISKWGDYAFKPSAFISSMESEYYLDNKEICDYQCEYIMKTQLPDGSWDINWRWEDYPDEWAISRNAFSAFCKVVLRHEAINAWRDLKRKDAREISLDYLMSERYFEPSAMDSYFEKQDKLTAFLVLGREVIVDNEQLATTLLRLPKLRREVLLLYYFVGYRDEAIGRLYGRCRSTINSRRNVALKQLRKEWERLEHEEQETDTF